VLVGALSGIGLVVVASTGGLRGHLSLGCVYGLLAVILVKESRQTLLRILAVSLQGFLAATADEPCVPVLFVASVRRIDHAIEIGAHDLQFSAKLLVSWTPQVLLALHASLASAAVRCRVLPAVAVVLGVYVRGGRGARLVRRDHLLLLADG